MKHDADTAQGVSAFLSLGGNLGDRAAILCEALRKLNENGFALNAVSSVYETAPVGCEPGAGAFCNLAAGGVWHDSPESLLRLCQRMEVEAGRPAEHPHWHSRTLDIDIVLFGDRIIQKEYLTVPHPRMSGRLFVLVPLAEIAPEVLVPGEGGTVSDLLASLKNGGFSHESIVKITDSPFFCGNFS